VVDTGTSQVTINAAHMFGLEWTVYGLRPNTWSGCM